ncbi:substrate-binding periplasmic protein [Pseudoduganella violacea]|uniref:ABC-type amino acid transport substrate-binding protein n=1 Tax=Pseudoduganella violacea TaxID=1715466 RepID=A0A7W5BA51_9BURK|nr:transporter substrate-binding domain-containing protein [Pseudoduganella violacea]MBB3119384.1 ABC-type amino acid transport substrate-binding protein [Pseudoduganella violacea]
MTFRHLRRTACSLLAALLLAAPALADPGRLIVLVATGTEMPISEFRAGELVGGIHKDLGEALAQQLGRRAQFLAMPRKRIAQTLEVGRADVLCMYMPEWLPGSFYWSSPFFPVTELLVSDRRWPRPLTVADVGGQQIATVLGYHYPELEHALGAEFVRADGPSNEINLRKLGLGRVRHAATLKALLDYRLKLGDRLEIHPPLHVKTYLTRCAVSEKSGVTLADVNAAIAGMHRDGVIHRIVSNYQ